jgi:ABC-type polysaccharide/polyol phosphate export permease
MELPVDDTPALDRAPALRRRAAAQQRDLKGLIWTLVRTDVKVHYHGSLAGFTWALLRPLSMFVALVGVMGIVFSSQPNFMLNLIVGLFIYEFFAAGTKAGLTSLWSKGYLLTKARFPIWIVVLTSSVNAIIVLLVFMTTVLIYLAVAGPFPTPLRLLLFFGYIVQMWLIILGISLALSPLYLRYRDLTHIWDAVTQAGFFVAPIIITLDMIPAHVHRYLFLWPPTPVIVHSRDVLITGVVPGAAANLYLLTMTAAILSIGLIVWRRFVPGAAEQL